MNNRICYGLSCILVCCVFCTSEVRVLADLGEHGWLAPIIFVKNRKLIYILCEYSKGLTRGLTSTVCYQYSNIINAVLSSFSRSTNVAWVLKIRCGDESNKTGLVNRKLVCVSNISINREGQS